jgi:glycosyltransferase involved in cell wall biosynthesis
VADRLKLRVWTPLPPLRSGVADHNAMLLPAMTERCDVTVVVDDDRIGAVRAPEHVALVKRSEAHAHATDLSIYHMGNHHGLHRVIHDELIAHPGVVVLHDPSLVDFYGGYHEGSAGGFDDEVVLNHGRPGELPRVRAGTEWHVDRLAVHLARRVVDPSLAVVVHSPWAQAELARQFPGKVVHHVDLAAPLASDRAGRPDIRARLGWNRDNVVFGLLGGLWQHKRPQLVVRTFAALHPLRPQARLLVAGRLEDREAVGRMLAAVSQAGLGGAVEVLTDVPDDEFTACVAACDAVVDLRWPSAGETSATVMRGFGAGRPAIVSDLPQYAALDQRFCRRVPTDPPGAARGALEVMLAMARDPSQTREAGRLARRFVEQFASIERVAGRYAELAGAAVSAGGRRPAD